MASHRASLPGRRRGCVLSAHPEITGLIAAAKASRKFISASRHSVIECHAMPPSYFLSTVTDEGALAWIAEHDALIEMLDDAIAVARATGGTS